MCSLGRTIVALSMCALALVSSYALATESEPTAADSAELAKELQNPVAALISVPLQSNFEWGSGPHSDGFKFTLNVQPVIPISLTEGWNVISRTIMPLIHQDDVVPGTTQGGMGDIVQSLFLSPKKPGPGGLIWGAGPVFLLPTSTDRFLGAEKFGMGPTAVLLRQDRGFTYGLLFNHLVSIGGTRSTSDVNATFVQPFLTYTTSTYTSFGVNTESTYDWENSKWTVPLNATLSQLLKIAGQPIQLALGPKWYAEGPSAAPDWGLRFTITLLFPT